MSVEYKRWEKRFFSFEKELLVLKQIIDKPDFSETDFKNLMVAFEKTHELSWKTLQELLEEEGYTQTHGPRLIIDQSFELGYIEDAKAWMHMSLNRHLGQEEEHTDVVDEVVEEILESYLNLFVELQLKLNTFISRKE